MPTSNGIKIYTIYVRICRDGDMAIPRFWIPRNCSSFACTTKTDCWIIGCVPLDGIMSFSGDMFSDPCYPCTNKTTRVRKLRKFRRQMEDTLVFPRFRRTESHATLKAGLCVLSRFHSRSDSSCFIAKCTKYINPPDDVAPISHPLQGVGIKFARGLSGVFGTRSHVEWTIHFVLHFPYRNIESSMRIDLVSSLPPPFRILLLETQSLFCKIILSKRRRPHWINGSEKTILF